MDGEEDRLLAGLRLGELELRSNRYVSSTDLYSACKLQGIPARTAISEYAPGQVEITLELLGIRQWTKPCATSAWSRAWRTNTG